MKKLFVTTILCSSIAFASLNSITSFKGEFTQTVTDDKNVSLNYKGYVQAQKPQNALWNYTLPVKKDVYLDGFSITIVEPEIEQVIIRRLESNFDFFIMIENAIEIDKNKYKAKYKEKEFIIKTKNNLIESISYYDEFENGVKIIFTNQKQNVKIDDDVFVAKYSSDFDVVGD